MNKPRRSLLLAMMIYALIFVLLLIGALFLFTNYLSDYENSRPVNVVRLYHRTMPNEDIDRLSDDLIAQMNPQIINEEKCREYIRALVATAELVKSRDDSSDDQMVYLLRSGERTLGKLVLRPEEKTRYGFTHYSITPEDFDFSFLVQQQQFTIPEGWTVRCNGKALGADRIVSTDGQYTLLEEFYDDPEYSLPHLLTYDTGLYMLDLDVQYLDSQGREVPEINEDVFADNCSAAEKANVTGVAYAFVEAYIAYSSNSNQNTSGNYYRLVNLIVEGSTLQKRMRYAVDGLSWASSMGDELQSIDFHHVMSLGNGYNNTIGRKGLVTTENNLKLILVNNGDTLLVTAMSSY